MKVENNLKFYWARKGDNKIFGHDWQARLGMSDDEATARFDEAWVEHIEPVLRKSPAILTERARDILPNDGRMQRFSPTQEHRLISLFGEEYLVQIDPRIPKLTQMWHLYPKSEAPRENVSAAANSEFVTSEDPGRRPASRSPGHMAPDEDGSDEPVGGLRTDTLNWLCERARLSINEGKRAITRINQQALERLSQ